MWNLLVVAVNNWASCTRRYTKYYYKLEPGYQHHRSRATTNFDHSWIGLRWKHTTCSIAPGSYTYDQLWILRLIIHLDQGTPQVHEWHLAQHFGFLVPRNCFLSYTYLHRSILDHRCDSSCRCHLRPTERWCFCRYLCQSISYYSCSLCKYSDYKLIFPVLDDHIMQN